MKNALLAIALGTSAACLSGSPGTLPPASGEVAAVTKKIVKKNVVPTAVSVAPPAAVAVRRDGRQIIKAAVGGAFKIFQRHHGRRHSRIQRRRSCR